MPVVNNTVNSLSSQRINTLFLYIFGFYQDAKRHNAKQFTRWTLMSSTCKCSFLGHAFLWRSLQRKAVLACYCTVTTSHIYNWHCFCESKCVTKPAASYTALVFSIWLSHFSSTTWADEHCSAPSLKGKSCNIMTANFSAVDFEGSLHTLTFCMQILGLLARGCVKLILGSVSWG